MKEELTKRAKTNLKKIRAFQIVTTIFGCASIILFVISTQANPNMRIWVNFPTLLMMTVLAIVYVSMFGFSFGRGMNLEHDDDALEDEISRLYTAKTEGLQLKEGVDMDDRLELLELERIKERAEMRQNL